MSPEQCLDEDLDGRSDVYSLACVIYEALTGKSPVCARTAFETMNRHLTAMPAPLATVRADLRWPDKLEATLSRAYAKKPKDRYQSMAEFQTALKKVIDLPVEIEWPERWTARSERTEAALKVAEPVEYRVVIDPAQSIEVLLKYLSGIPERIQSGVVLLMIAFFFVLLGFMAFQAGTVNGLVLFGIVGLVVTYISSVYWSSFFESQNIEILKNVSLYKAQALVGKLRPQRISIIEVTKLRADFCQAIIEFSDADHKLVSEKVVVRNITLGEVWSEWKTAAEIEAAAKTIAVVAAPGEAAIKLRYPLTGYLFCDEGGRKIAISILSEVGWIYGQRKFKA